MLKRDELDKIAEEKANELRDKLIAQFSETTRKVTIGALALELPYFRGDILIINENIWVCETDSREKYRDSDWTLVKPHIVDTGKLETDFITLRTPVDQPISKEEADLRLIAAMVNNLSLVCYSRARAAGWYTDLVTMQPKVQNKGERLLLIVSEIVEAFEGLRKNLMDDHIPHRTMEEVELADTIIRICDYAGSYGLDVGGAILDKLEYNKNREDHKIENRQKENGKKY